MEKGNVLVAASQEAHRWRKNHFREIPLILPLFARESFHVDFLKNKIVEFDDNLAVVS